MSRVLAAPVFSLRPLASALAAALGMSAVLVSPATLAQVQNCNDSGAGSLREVVANASNGTVDLSNLSCSTISLTTGSIEITQNSLSLLGPSSGTLSIEVAPDLQDRALKHTGQGTLDLQSITVANGNYQGADSRGGCIFSLGYVELIDSKVSGCRLSGSGTSDAKGGGIYAVFNVTLLESVVSNNLVVGADEGGASGGGIAAGGVALYDSSVFDNHIVGNSKRKTLGGGVFANQSLGVTLDNSRVCGSTIESDGNVFGGGIYSIGIVHLGNGSSVCGNTATGYHATGGGIHGDGGVIIGTGSVVSGNRAAGERWSLGGGIRSGGVVYLDNASIRGNEAYTQMNSVFALAKGGGVASFGAMHIRNSTINNNSVQSDGSAYGGGMFGHGEFRLVNSTVSGNRATGGSYGIGGGLAIYSENYLINSTIVENGASDRGGGLAILENPSIVSSSVIANNDAPAGADLSSILATPIAIFGSFNLVEHPGIEVALSPDTLHVDPMLLPLSEQGGAYHLAVHVPAPGSPLLDAGADPAFLEFDQRGDGFARVVGAAPDIGAAERQGPGDGDRIFSDNFGW